MAHRILQFTSLASSLGLHWLEMNTRHRTDEFHWFSFDETSVLRVPSGSLKEETLDKDSILKYIEHLGDFTSSANNSLKAVYSSARTAGRMFSEPARPQHCIPSHHIHITCRNTQHVLTYDFEASQRKRHFALAISSMNETTEHLPSDSG